MKRLISSSLLAFASLSIGLSAFAQTSSPTQTKASPKSAVSSEDLSPIQKRILTKFPKLNKVDVAKVPDLPLYMFTVNGRVAYTDAQVSYVFTNGNLLSSETADNLTVGHQLTFNTKLFQNLPKDQAFKTVYGKGERVLYTIEDPDCPGCREFTRLLHAYPDPAKLNLTVYTFPFPLESIHPDARTKAVSIWCSSTTEQGRSEAWKKWMLQGEMPKGTTNCKNPVKDNIVLFQSLGVGATPTLFLPDGSAVMGGIEADKLIKALDVMTKK